MNTKLAAVAIVVALAVLAAVFLFARPSTPTISASVANMPARPTVTDAPTSTLSPEASAALQKSHGFQYLVSYTNKGFAPATLSVKKGETVRFTNNADGTLTLAISGIKVASLARAEYVEYTFNKAGTFDYSNGTTSGVVTVK